MLEGLDGINKMSKSLGNYIGITESPNDIFGKLMSISNELMWRYIELLSFAPLAEIRRWKSETQSGRNPRDIKVAFAQEIVSRFYSPAAATAALADFEARFKQGEIPDDIATTAIDAGVDGTAIANLLKQAGLCVSTSDALRMIGRGGVRIDGEKVTDKALRFSKERRAVRAAGRQA